jgi:hypothetical protein
MAQFYVATEADADRCRLAGRERTRITITGIADNGEVADFTGMVQAVERTSRGRDKLWRVTMSDADVKRARR